MHALRNVAIIRALRGDFRLTFFEAGLKSDPAGVLERQGPNMRFCRFLGHGDKIVTRELEIARGETEVHEGVRV
jgi:uncharacterized protein YdeI (YjbR/CyaY-like superfamily)